MKEILIYIGLAALGAFVLYRIVKSIIENVKRERFRKKNREAQFSGSAVKEKKGFWASVFSSNRSTWAERIGENGERTVSSYLADLECDDYQVFNDLLLRDGNYTTQIDHIILSRYGVFVIETKTPRKYRNPFLAAAMVNIKMIDTQGLGIHTLFQRQRDRYLPMPDYDLSEPGEVSLTIPGTVLDEDYSLMLIKHTDLDLETAILLDRVQKHKPLSAEAVKELRKRNLVEGRKNALIVAKSVAQATEQEVEYTRAKGFTDEFCMDLIEKAVQEHERLSRPRV